MPDTPLSKAIEIVQAAPRAGTTFARGPVQVRLLEDVVLEGEQVRCVIEVRRNGVILPVSNPVYIVNPPVLIDDPTGGIIRGQGATLRRLSRNPHSALGAVLLDFAESL